MGVLNKVNKKVFNFFTNDFHERISKKRERISIVLFVSYDIIKKKRRGDICYEITRIG